MPKRTGFLYEQMIEYDNCLLAEKEMLKGKKNNRTAKRMKKNPEAYAKRMQDSLVSGTWEPHPYREKVIYDSHRGKYRNLKIPCLEDQAIHHAVMRVAVPHIMRRNYYYNCGSIPGAGQIRITRALRRWLSKKSKVKYAALMDIRKFYDSLPHWVVIKALEHIFKDAKFIAINKKILYGMSKDGVGLAIGFYPSVWYANLALAFIDRMIQSVKGVRFVRFVDDIAAIGNNKRVLHRTVTEVSKLLISVGLALKHTWQVFRINSRGLSFLSYRFFNGYTIMRKDVMYRVSRRMRNKRNITAKRASSIVSSMGILKHCDSYNFRKLNVYPIVNIKKCKRIISEEGKNRNKRANIAA
jgi:RNA-directed DNA polymerase